MVSELSPNEIEAVSGGVTIRVYTVAQPVNGGKKLDKIMGQGDPTNGHNFSKALAEWQAQFPLLDRMNFGYQDWP